MPLARPATLATRVLPAPGTYLLNPARCLAEFSVRHMVVSTARGSLTAIDGELVVSEDPLDSWVRVDLDATSFTTGSEERDRAVLGPDFLDADAFPVVRFESVGVTETGDGRFDIPGDLYIRDLVGPVTLATRLVAVDPGRAVFSATATLSRSSYGLTWGAAIEKVGVVVADTVTLTLAAEFVQ